MYSKTDEREGWADFVKTVAIFSVVWLHVAAPWVYRYGLISSFDWQVSNIADSLVRISVPLFFMATGYLLLKNPIILKNYLARRLNRIVIPWVLWSFIYMIYNSHRNGIKLTFLDGVLAFLNGNVNFHLWYLYALVGMYLFVPILHWMIQDEPKIRSAYFLVIWFFAASIIPFSYIITRYFTTKELFFAIDFGAFGGYSGYLIAGFLIGKYNASRKSVVLSLGLYTIATIFTAIATSLGTSNTGRLVEYFYDYLSPNIVIASLGGFAFLKATGITLSKIPILASIFQRLSNDSLGIFLIHPIIHNTINDGFFGSFLASFMKTTSLSIPVSAIIIFALSFAVTEAIRYIPIVRKAI